MQRLKYLVAVLGLAAAAVSAQPPGRPHGGPLDIERLTVLLDLDAYQKGEVERVLEEQRAAMSATRAELSASGERPSHDEVRARREENRDALITRLSAVLTEQQITKLKVLMEPPFGARGPGGRPPVDE